MKKIIRESQISRLETFSDAVFAFSATLLVVTLKVPSTIPELVGELKGFAAFGFSFFALVLIWSVHKAFFRRYELQDRWTVVLNSCLLFVVLFYVYPLKFVTEGLVGAAVQFNTAGTVSTMFMLYSLGFSAVFLCVALLYFHAWRSREKLELMPDETSEARFYFRHYMFFVGVGLFSVLIAWLQWGLIFGLPGLVYILLWPLCSGHGSWSNRSGSTPPHSIS